MSPPPDESGDDSARGLPQVERYAAHHDRSRFVCGETELDDYIRERVTEDEDRRAAAIYVLVDPATDPTRVLGYYSLSMFSFGRSSATRADQRRLPRYRDIPAVLIGRLALDQTLQGRGLGSALLTEALERALAVSGQISAAVVVVHSLHEAAASFYERHGFIRFRDEPLHLYYPLATLAAGLS